VTRRRIGPEWDHLGVTILLLGAHNGLAVEIMELFGFPLFFAKKGKGNLSNVLSDGDPSTCSLVMESRKGRIIEF